MVLVYATSSDLAAWTSTTAPSNATQVLRTASLQVTEATEAAFYLVDTTGMPTDTVTLQAFKDATCAQAAALVAIGADPNAGGTSAAGIEVRKEIGTASIYYDPTDAANASASKIATLNGLCLDANRILRQAGLITNQVWRMG